MVCNQPWSTYPDVCSYRLSGASRTAFCGASGALCRSLTGYSIYSPHTRIGLQVNCFIAIVSALQGRMTAPYLQNKWWSRPLHLPPISEHFTSSTHWLTNHYSIVSLKFQLVPYLCVFNGMPLCGKFAFWCEIVIQPNVFIYSGIPLFSGITAPSLYKLPFNYVRIVYLLT